MCAMGDGLENKCVNGDTPEEIGLAWHNMALKNYTEFKHSKMSSVYVIETISNKLECTECVEIIDPLNSKEIREKYKYAVKVYMVEPYGEWEKLAVFVEQKTSAATSYTFGISSGKTVYIKTTKGFH